MQIKLKYFDTSDFNGFSGRGGAIRFYMLQHDMQFEEEVVSFDAWGTGVKAEVIKSGESPTGHLPIVYIDDGQPMIESLSILRHFSKQAEEYGKDIDRDFLVDMVADAAAEFRAALVTSAFGSPEDKNTYKTSPDKRKHYYSMLNTFSNKCNASGPHVVGNQASFADPLVFGIIWDDVATYGKEPSLWEANPRVVNFFEAFLKQGPVAKWCKGVRPDLVGQSQL